jgi:fucose 4-O-acetylase-like acetyltransferase
MKTRNYGIDVIKGICILLVVLCHTVLFENLPTILARIASGVFLKLFFMVSGYLAWKPDSEDKNVYLKRIDKRFKSLIVPYIVFSLGTILWHIIICVGFNNTIVCENYVGWKVIERDIFCTFSGIGIGTLWFLPVLFFSFAVLEILLIILRKIENLPRYGILIILGLILIAISRIVIDVHFDTSNLIGKIKDEYMYTLYRICYGSGYSLLGYVFHGIWTYTEGKPKRFRLIIVFEAVIGVMAVFAYSMPEDYGVFDLIANIFIMVMILALFETNAKDKLCKWMAPLIFCGQNSLSITIYHYLLLYPVEKIWFDGWLLFAVNLVTTVILILLVRNQKWHKKAIGIA